MAVIGERSSPKSSGTIAATLDGMAALDTEDSPDLSTGSFPNRTPRTVLRSKILPEVIIDDETNLALQEASKRQKGDSGFGGYPISGVINPKLLPEHYDRENGIGFKITKDLLRNKGIEVCDCALEIINTPEFQRLFYVSQQLVGLTERGRWARANQRFDHSLHTYDLAKKLLTRLGLSEYEVKIGSIAALLHDFDHLALNHAGEVISEILQRAVKGRVDPAVSDHDEMLLNSFRGDVLRPILEKHGLDPNDLASAFSDDDPKFHHITTLVKEGCDRAAYLCSDVYSTEFPEWYRKWVREVSQYYLEGFYLETRGDEIFVGHKNPILVDATLRIRNQLFYTYAFSPSRLVLHEIAIRAARTAFDERKFDIPDLRYFVDDELIECFSEREQQWMKFDRAPLNRPVGQDFYVEDFMFVPIAFTLADVNPESLNEICNPSFRKKIREILGEGTDELGGHASSVYYVVTPNYGKGESDGVNLVTSPGGEPDSFFRELPLCFRHVFVAVARDSLGMSPWATEPNQKAKEIREKLHKFFASYLKEDPSECDYSEVIFDDINDWGVREF